MREKAQGVCFVAGATGFTGRETVRLLREAGAEVAAHVRPDSNRLEEWRRRFGSMGAQVDETPWERQSMTQTMRRIKPAAVLALYGTTRSRMKAAADPGRNDYMAVDYGLTVILIEALKAAGVNARFLYLSAAGAGKPGKSPYGKARHLAERAVIESGLSYTIARPSFIIGPGRDDHRPGEKYGAALIDSLLSLASFLGTKNFAARYKSTTNLILAGALASLALDPDAENRIYESEKLR